MVSLLRESSLLSTYVSKIKTTNNDYLNMKHGYMWRWLSYTLLSYKKSIIDRTVNCFGNDTMIHYMTGQLLQEHTGGNRDRFHTRE